MAALVATVMLVSVAAIDPVEPPYGPVYEPVAETATEPQTEPEEAEGPFLSPYEYLYAMHPRIARRMDCTIARESRWTPSAVNPRSGASGLAQFILSTWRITPQGQAGMSRFDPYANIDAAAWLVTNTRQSWGHWQVIKMGLC